MLIDDPEALLDDLLGTSIAELDIPETVYKRAVQRYGELASWLDNYWIESHAGGLIYPQGSIRLGTIVRPLTVGVEYDVDLVCRRDLRKSSTTQKALKADVGAAVAKYVASQPDGAPRHREGKRCWTLEYPAEPFHMDILPAIPDTDAAPNGILLTDRQLVEWQRSNPVDYASWFERRMVKEMKELRARLAREMEVQEVPLWHLKTTLQRTVQALKRHRDLYFEEDPEARPASIIITTLAARAYKGYAPLHQVLLDVASTMPGLVEQRDGVWWVANPVQLLENFADRWRSNPGCDERFFEWMEQAQEDFSGFAREKGLDRVLSRVAKSFGEEPARRAEEAFGAASRSSRDRGNLRIAGATGLTAVGATKPVPRHTFHGDAT